MQELITFGKRVVSSHRFSAGTALIAEMTDTMYVVLATDPNGWILTSRNFAFTESCKKAVLKACRSHYNYVKNCLARKKPELLDELD